MTPCRLEIYETPDKMKHTFYLIITRKYEAINAQSGKYIFVALFPRAFQPESVFMYNALVVAAI